MWFRRITEIQEVDLPKPSSRNAKVSFGETSFTQVEFGAQSPKRKSEDEDVDYSRFKRVRVVSKAKRLKTPRTFSRARGLRAFNGSNNQNHIPKSLRKTGSERALALGTRSATHRWGTVDMVDNTPTSPFGRDLTTDELLAHLSKSLPYQHSSATPLQTPNNTLQFTDFQDRDDREFSDDGSVTDSVASQTSVMSALHDISSPSIGHVLDFTYKVQNDTYKLDLHEACEEAKQGIVESLLREGADIDAVDNAGWTPLMKAVHNGRIHIAKLLLDHGASIKTVKICGVDPLHLAARKGRFSVARLLLENGADVLSRDEDGNTPLDHAFDSGHMDVVQLLLEKGADPSINERKITLIGVSAFNGDSNKVRALLTRGEEVNTTNNPHQATPLYLAALGDNIETITLLLDNGADLEATDIEGWTPLIRASNNSRLGATKLLIERGANIASTDKTGQSPLHVASGRGHVEAVGLLLEQGADSSAVDVGGFTPLNIAAEKGRPGVVELLLSRGANPSIANDKGWTPLISAAACGHYKTVETLLDHGADTLATTTTGQTSLHMAAECGRIEIVKLLLERRSVAAGGH